MTLIFTELWLLLRITYYTWAQRQMCPSHPDAPYVALMLHWLTERRQRLIKGERA